ncbi:MAG: regulatory protein RecX [Clostridia bacterium]|nr:regulatory protein RecX [Clostridia bacterium]
MYLKSIFPTTSSVTLAVAPDEPETAPTDPGSGTAHPRPQLFVLSPREWNLLNRALGYDPASGLTLTEGAPLDEHMFTLLEEAAERTAALRFAARLLSAADSSEEVLRRKLAQKGYSDAAADAAIRRLVEKGALDDRSAAARYAEALLVSKHYGRRRIFSMLLGRGFSRELARETVEALDPDALASALDTLVRRRAPGLCADDPAERRKAAAVLMRLGYTGDEIREAAKRARED